jgi:hypothetical protein
MARDISPDSVSSKVGKLEINDIALFNNPYTSVTVMVSMLKRKKEHKDKIFKIRIKDDVTTVIRIK